MAMVTIPMRHSGLGPLMAALVLVGWLPLCACGESGAAAGGVGGGGSSAGAGGAGAGGAGGSGGAALVEGCVDIHADERSLPDPEAWQWVPGDIALQPFWVDASGVHFVWTARPAAGSQAYLVVSTFDRETGSATDSRFYEAFPADVAYSMTSIFDAAGSPDGAFAALVNYQDLAAPDGVLQKVVLGDVAEASLVAEWVAPWSVLEAHLFHVGWDGEAFAVHAKRAGTGTVLLVRLAPDGTVLTPETEVGSITTFSQDISVFHTDADSGISWMMSRLSPGAWLSGHQRDGTLLAGTEALGGVVIDMDPFGPCNVTSSLALASSGERAMMAWRAGSGAAASQGQTCLQPLTGAAVGGELLGLLHDQNFYGTTKVLAADGDGWWMGMLEVDTGIHSYRLSSDGEVVSKSPLITYTNCSQTCGGTQQNLLNVYLFSTARFEDELWFGFMDATDSFTVSEEHPARYKPFRIVLAKDGCTYLTEFETNYPP